MKNIFITISGIVAGAIFVYFLHSEPVENQFLFSSILAVMALVVSYFSGSHHLFKIVSAFLATSYCFELYQFSIMPSHGPVAILVAASILFLIWLFFKMGETVIPEFKVDKSTYK